MKSFYINYKEQSLTYTDIRTERTRLIAYVGLLLSDIKKSMNLFPESYAYLKKTL